MDRSEFLGLKESRVVAGLAIILMLTLHFFALDEVRSIGGGNYLSISDIFDMGNFKFIRLFGEFGNICVAMFAVSSGYVVWKYQTKYNNYYKVAERLIKFLFGFWVILLIYIMYGLIFDEPLPIILPDFQTDTIMAV